MHCYDVYNVQTITDRYYMLSNLMSNEHIVMLCSIAAICMFSITHTRAVA